MQNRCSLLTRNRYKTCMKGKRKQQKEENLTVVYNQGNPFNIPTIVSFLFITPTEIMFPFNTQHNNFASSFYRNKWKIWHAKSTERRGTRGLTVGNAWSTTGVDETVREQQADSGNWHHQLCFNLEVPPCSQGEEWGDVKGEVGPKC
jgi:hypothetical protein